MPTNSHDEVQQVCEELNNINPVEERLKVVFLVQVFVLHNLKSKQEGYSQQAYGIKCDNDCRISFKVKDLPQEGYDEAKDVQVKQDQEEPACHFESGVDHRLY